MANNKTVTLLDTKAKLDLIIDYVERLIMSEADVSQNTLKLFNYNLSNAFDAFESSVVDDLVKEHEKCLSSVPS